MQVSLENKDIRSLGDEETIYPLSYIDKYPLKFTLDQIKLQSSREGGGRYTLLMTDEDAPLSPYLHYFEANISVPMQGVLGDVYTPYLPPSPPDDKVHRYTLSLWYQPYGIVQAYRKSNKRNSFPLGDYIYSNGLQLVDHWNI